MRAVIELSGIKGTSHQVVGHQTNRSTTVRATIAALQELRTAPGRDRRRAAAARRWKDIVGKRWPRTTRTPTAEDHPGGPGPETPALAVGAADPARREEGRAPAPSRPREPRAARKNRP